MDMLSNRQSMQFLKNWGDIIYFSNICHYASCTILNLLKVVNVIIRNAIYSKELQQYVQDVTKTWTTVTSDSCVKNAFKQWMFLRWQQAARHTDVTYSYILPHLSKITPRFYTDPLGIIEDEPICNTGVFRDLT